MTNILFIEDDQLDQMAFQRFVKRQNLAYSYTIVDTVADAMIEIENGSYDIILSDYNLKDGTAFDFINSVDTIDVPIIFMTGAGAEEVAVRALKNGAKDYIVKGLENEHLNLVPLTIEKVIRKKKSEDLVHLTQFERSVAGVLKIKPTGEFISCNETFAQVAGFLSERQLLQDQTWCGSFKVAFNSILSTLNQNDGYLTNYELNFQDKKGNIVHTLANITRTAGDDLKREVIQTTLVDISKLKKEESARQEKEKEVDKLQEALRLRENLSSMIVHDLRNPISIIGLSADLIRQSHDAEEISELADRITRNVVELEELTNDMLTIARMKQGELAIEPSMDDFVNLAERAIQRFQPLANRYGIELILNRHINQLIAGYDVKLLHRVLDNLLSNAIKFAPTRSRVTMTIDLSGSDEQPKLYFSIADQGAGIPLEDHGVIFEQFKIGKVRSERGTQFGMGLPFCKMVVEAHQGSITVWDNYPKGAQFVVEIPIKVENDQNMLESPSIWDIL